MIEQVIRAFKNSKIVKALFSKNYDRVELKTAGDGEHPWQQDLDHLAKKLGEEEVKVVRADRNETKMAESTVVEKDFQNLFSEVKDELQQKQSGSKAPVVVKKKREADITAVDLKSWWGQSVATWDPGIDGKNVDSDAQQPRRQRTKWFDG